MGFAQLPERDVPDWLLCLTGYMPIQLADCLICWLYHRALRAKLASEPTADVPIVYRPIATGHYPAGIGGRQMAYRVSSKVDHTNRLRGRCQTLVDRLT